MKYRYLKTSSQHLLLAVFFTSLILTVSAQDSTINVVDEADKNVAKMNVTGLLFRNYSFQYERLISRKITVGANFRFMPKGAFPLLDSFEDLIDDEDTFNQLKDISISHTSFAPEVRFYFGKKDGPRGFYIAPFARFSTYKLGFDKFEFEVETEVGNEYVYRTETIPLSGSISSFTGGFSIGAQWRIGKWVYLDWNILAPSYGSANGKLTGQMALSPEEQDALREELEDFELDPVKTTATVDGNGARLNLKGPWAGIRAGLAVGVKF